MHKARAAANDEAEENSVLLDNCTIKNKQSSKNLHPKLINYYNACIYNATITYSMHSISAVTDEDVMLTYAIWELGMTNYYQIINATIDPAASRLAL